MKSKFAPRFGNLEASKGDAVMIFLNNDYIVKDFVPKNNGLFLVPKNENYPTISVTDNDDYETFGVVTGFLRGFKKNLLSAFHK